MAIDDYCQKIELSRQTLVGSAIPEQVGLIGTTVYFRPVKKPEIGNLKFANDLPRQSVASGNWQPGPGNRLPATRPTVFSILPFSYNILKFGYK